MGIPLESVGSVLRAHSTASLFAQLAPTLCSRAHLINPSDIPKPAG